MSRHIKHYKYLNAFTIKKMITICRWRWLLCYIDVVSWCYHYNFIDFVVCFECRSKKQLKRFGFEPFMWSLRAQQIRWPKTLAMPVSYVWNTWNDNDVDKQNLLFMQDLQTVNQDAISCIRQNKSILNMFCCGLNLLSVIVVYLLTFVDYVTIPFPSYGYKWGNVNDTYLALLHYL